VIDGLKKLLMINSLFEIIKFRNVLVLAIVLFGMNSCDKKIDIPINKNKNFPSRKIYNAKVVEKDSGIVKYRLTAPLIEEYAFLKTPVTLFPKGIKIIFNKKNSPNSGSLRADFAKVISSKKWYEARGNIRVVTPEGDTMYTKSFYLNSKIKKIYTKDSVKIIRIDKSIIYANNGLEASEDFSSYKLFNNQNSELMVKDLN